MQSKSEPVGERGQAEASSRTPLLKSDTHDYSSRDALTAESASPQDDDVDRWDAKNNTSNPRNWKPWFKWMTVALVSFIEFMTSMPNFMYAPNISDAQEDLDTDDRELMTFSLTIYILGFALGPLLFAPCSELYGRVPVYRWCLVAFLIMTAGCGLSQNVGMLVAFRFLAGSFGAAPVAIGGAVVGDLFPVEERGTAMSIYQAGQIISAVVGPPIGGLIGSFLAWRWVFWIVCILSGFALVCALLVLHETHAPTLKRKIYGSNYGEAEKQQLGGALKSALSRPLQLLAKSPVVLAGCVLIFLVIGLLNIFLTELSRTVQQTYGISSGQSGSMYLGLALGFVAASIVFGTTNDKIVRALARRYNSDLLPEYRLPATILAMPIVVVGTLWYGWALQLRAHWTVPIVGSGIAGLGITTIQLSVITYMIDSFDEFSASALAAITMARSVGGAILPLIGPILYEQLDQGWGNSVLALVGLMCGVIPILMYKYGARWRASFSPSDLQA